MKRFFICLLTICISTNAFTQKTDSLAFRNIFDEVMLHGEAYDWLHDLCKDVGHRLSGSPQADMAVRWGEAEMKKAGFDRVWLEEVMVPHWERGQKEFGELVGHEQFNVLALGGSIATPEAGITAEVVEVANFEELKALGAAQVKGKIVFFNHIFPQNVIGGFDGYGEAGPYRWYAPEEASKLGAIGSITRSVSSAYDEFPHTGSTGFRNGGEPIPCVAISTMEADMLSADLKKDPHAQFKMILNCKKYEDVKSYNVIGEITGSQFPNEIIVVGGHLDSWDVGEGAHDDGAGCVQSMEVIRALKALNMQPKRTIRCVLFMNEENGNMGGKTYGKYAADSKTEKHIAALESDAGGFSPRGIAIDSLFQYNKNIENLKQLFLQYGVYNFNVGHGGTDIGPMEDGGTLLFGLVPDSQRYMDLHHTDNDTFDKVNKRELQFGASVMAMFCWYLSEYGVN